jgi:hypothetical protein
MELLATRTDHGTDDSARADDVPAYYKSWAWNCFLQELIRGLLATRASHGTIDLIVELLGRSVDHGTTCYKSPSWSD